MSKAITSNKVKTSLDSEREKISANPEKWREDQRAKKAPAVSSNKTQPKIFKAKGRIVGSDLSKMITTLDVEPKSAKKAGKKAAVKKTPGKKGKQGTKKSSSAKKNVAPASSKEVKQENKA